MSDPARRRGRVPADAGPRGRRERAACRLLLAAALAFAATLLPGPGRAAEGPGPAAAAETAERAEAEPELAGRIWDVRAGRALPERAAVRALAKARYVLLGEVHDHPRHHALQARILRGLAARGRRPAVVFEMLSADVTEPLAALQAGPSPSADALRRAVSWDASGWPDFALYAPVFEAALASGRPVVAGDPGAEALQALRRGEHEILAPALREELGLGTPAPPAQRQVLTAAVREGHCGLLPESALPRMVAVQRARDAHLAHAARDAARRPGVDGAVVVAGAGHARRDVAVPWWIARREPGAALASVAFVEVEAGETDPARALAARFDGAAPFDQVWFTTTHPREDPCERMRRHLEESPQPERP